MQKRYQIKATTFDKRGMKLSVGRNSYTKTHPLQKYFSQKAGDSEHKSCLHAELDAILKSRGKEIYALHVERIESNGTTSMAKPCKACEEAIKAFGIVKVSYTTSTGVIEYEVL